MLLLSCTAKLAWLMLEPSDSESNQSREFKTEELRLCEVMQLMNVRHMIGETVVGLIPSVQVGILALAYRRLDVISPGSSTSSDSSKTNWLLIILSCWNQAPPTNGNTLCLLFKSDLPTNRQQAGNVRRIIQRADRLAGGCQYGGRLICEGDWKPDKHRQPPTLQQLVCGCCSSGSIHILPLLLCLLLLLLLSRQNAGPQIIRLLRIHHPSGKSATSPPDSNFPTARSWKKKNTSSRKQDTVAPAADHSELLSVQFDAVNPDKHL